MQIGQVAARLGISVSKIRFLEARGLIAPARLENGYRAYDDDAIVSLRVILQAQAFGFSLEEVAKTLRETTLDGLRSDFVIERLETKICELDRKAVEIGATRARLIAAVEELQSGHTMMLAGPP